MMKLYRIFFSMVIGLHMLIKICFSGDANFNTVIGARSLALNGMYLAGVDGLNANMFNPASAAYLEGYGIDLLLMSKMGEYTFGTGTETLHQSYRGENPLTSFGAYWNITGETGVTLGYFPVLDYIVDWPYALLRGDESNSVLLTFDLYNKLNVKAYSFDVAHLFDKFAIGFAANLYQISHNMAFPISTPNWDPSSIQQSAYQFNYKQDSWTFGVNAGISWQISNKIKLAGLIRSGYKTELEGTAQSALFSDVALNDTSANINLPPSRVDIKSEIEIPWVAGLGFIYKINPQLILNIDLLYNLWGNTNNSISINTNDQVWKSELMNTDSVTGISPGTVDMPAGSNLEIGLGIEVNTSEDLAIMSGYRYSQSPNNNQNYNLFFPTVNQHWFSIGLGFKEKNYRADLSASYGIGIPQKVRSSDNPFWSGEYKGHTFIPAMSFKYTF